MIRQFDGITPTVAESCYIDPSAVVIGDVIIGDDCSIWPMTAIRGDVNIIRIGNRCNIQDGSVLHAAHAGEFNPEGAELHIGNEVTVGHKVVLHACRVGDLCLIGMGAIIMDKAVVEDRVIIGAGSLVPPKKRLESGYLYHGSPVRKVRELNARELEFLSYNADYYVRLKQRY